MSIMLTLCIIIPIVCIALTLVLYAKSWNQVDVSALQTVGIDYCLVHHGTRNEDDPGDVCSWAYYSLHLFTDEDQATPCEFVDLVYIKRS